MTGVPQRKKKVNKVSKINYYLIVLGACLCGVVFFIVTNYIATSTNLFGLVSEYVIPSVPFVHTPRLNTVEYDQRMLLLAHIATSTQSTGSSTSTTTTTSTTTPVRKALWPVKTVYPKAGALLPFNRIVAYYGNFLSKQMGVLGQYPADEMIAKLEGEVKKWQEADPSTPVIPAIDYIAITAQGSPGADGKYRLRMSDKEIDKAIDLAARVNGIVVLDIQIGKSNLPAELPLLEKYLKMPQVHLAIDPEFSMKRGGAPGEVIGTFDAVDVNYAANYLAGLVKANNLPPKILIIHRFTRPMVTNYKDIEPLPEVQVVMDMDGWGPPSRKLGTYGAVVYGEPVQFTGFKLFYKNDILPPSTHMMTPTELLQITPKPIFIQYQ